MGTHAHPPRFASIGKRTESCKRVGRPHQISLGQPRGASQFCWLPTLYIRSVRLAIWFGYIWDDWSVTNRPAFFPFRWHWWSGAGLPDARETLILDVCSPLRYNHLLFFADCRPRSPPLIFFRGLPGTITITYFFPRPAGRDHHHLFFFSRMSMLACPQNHKHLFFGARRTKHLSKYF